MRDDIANPAILQIKLSLLKHDVPVGKRFSLDNNGTLHSTTNGRLESATVFPKTISSISGLQPIIEQATGYDHLCLGITGHDNAVGCYPNACVEGSVARDNKHFKFPKGPGVMCIDSDNITESIHDKLMNVCPAMAETAHIETTSSSSMIYKPEVWLRKFTGTHTFIAVKNGRDIKRALTVLHKRAILQGYGQHRVSAVGGFLERSFVDKMLDKPSQPIYLKPNLGEGLFQDKKIVEYDGAPLLDTRKAIPNLTDKEEETYQGLIQLAQFELQAECDAKREEWISNQPNRVTAEKALTTRTLDGAFIIDVAYMGSFSVHDILMKPETFHGKTCRDPFDDSHGSKTKAMIFTKQNRCMINSHAHGGCVYRLLDPTMVGFGAERVPVTDLYPDAKFNVDLLPAAVNPAAVNPVQPTDISTPTARWTVDQPVDNTTWLATHCNSQGKPKTTFEIFQYMIHSYGITVGYNVITKDIEMLGQKMRNEGDLKAEANYSVIHSLCKLNQIEVGSIDRYLVRLMQENEVNPVTNWVGSKPWNGISQIRPLFDTLNVIENEMSFTLFRKWCMGSLRLAKGEIERFEHVLVLQASDGGEGKSRWFNKLTPSHLNNSMSLRLDDKDQVKEAISYWMTELGELDSTFQRSEMKQMMGFLSKNKDNIRLPYAKASNSYQRRSSYMGTINNKNFLIDDSGDRRFWMLETGEINYEHTIDIQQFWAEIDTLTDIEWLDREDNRKIIDMNVNYKMEDPLTDRLESYFSRNLIKDGTRHLNTTQILNNAGIINPSKSQLNKSGRWLVSKGFIKRNLRINGMQIKGYDIPYFNEMLL